MPYIENGCLFIPTTKPYELGDEVFILLSLAIDENNKPALAGEIAWVKDGTGDKPTGVRFEKEAPNKVSEAAEKIPVACKVIWITPADAQKNRTPGIGVQFSPLDQGRTKRCIEELLGSALGSDRKTHTM